jgi:hypothetical protein
VNSTNYGRHKGNRVEAAVVCSSKHGSSTLPIRKFLLRGTHSGCWRQYVTVTLQGPILHDVCVSAYQHYAACYLSSCWPELTLVFLILADYE